MQRLLRVLGTMLLIVASTAGCVSEGEDDEAGPSTDTSAANNATARLPEVFQSDGSITASGPVVGVGGADPSFAVGDGATLIYAQIQWDDATQDIDLALGSPTAQTTSQAGETQFDHRAEGGAPGSPDSPHSLTVASPEPGDWFPGALASGAAAQVDYHIAITVYYAETEVPEGYTALP